MEEKTITKEYNLFEDFDTGDIVRLRSGGPTMTVDNPSGSRIICVWFDAADGYHSRDFDQGALEKVVSESKPAS